MFDLSLNVTTSSLDVIKRSLTKELPTVKSSHRCEAMARGLGYRTYASLLQSVAHGADAAVDGAAFCRYLSQHGFNAAGSTLYQAAAAAALLDVANRYPTLTVRGFGIGDWDPSDTAATRRKEFAEARQSLVGESSLKPFLASLALLSRVKRTKTIRPATGSYGLKHIAENYRCKFPTGEDLGPVYVPNGAFIAAAIHAGFKVKPYRDVYGRETLNAGFNMSKPSIDDLNSEARPNSGRAQDRLREEARRAPARMREFTF